MWCCSSFIAFQRHPSTFRGLSPGFYTHFILSNQLIAEWFVAVIRREIFFHSFTASAMVLSGHFLPTGVFYLMLLPKIFGTTCYHQGLPGSRQFFLEVCRTWSDARNTDPAHLFVWLTVIHNLLYNLDLYLYMSILQKLLLVVKTLMKILFFSGSVLDKIRLLSRSATTLISNHEDIKQQPH